MQIIFSRKSKTTFWNNEILTEIIAVVGLGIEVVIGLVGVEVEGLMLVPVVPDCVSTVILPEREKIIKTFLMKGVYLPCLTRYYVYTVGCFRVPKSLTFKMSWAKCTTFLVKTSFVYMRMKNHFHIEGWALNLVLIQRPEGTRKWPIHKGNSFGSYFASGSRT